MKDLERRVEALEERLARVESPSAPPAWKPLPAKAPTAAQERAPVMHEYEEEARPARSLEEMVGGNLLPKVGILVLVIGVVFFLQYAFRRGWINEWGQLTLGVVGGLALWGAGEWLGRRGRFGVVYPQVLAGGGAIILYATVWVAYQVDRYRDVTGLTLEADGLLLGVVALGLVGYAVWRDLEHMALVAGVLVVTTTFAANEWSAFAAFYVVAGTAAVLAGAVVRGWPKVPALLLVPLQAALWFLLLADDQEAVAYAAIALTVPYVALAFAKAGRGPNVDVLRGVAVAGALLTFWLWTLFTLPEAWQDRGADRELVSGLVTLAYGSVPILVALAPRLRAPDRWGLLPPAAVMLLAWPPIQFDGEAIPAIWAAEVFIATWIARQWPRAWADVLTFAAAGLVALFLGIETRTGIEDGTVSLGLGTSVFALGSVALAVAWLLPVLGGRGEEWGPRGLLALATLVPVAYLGTVLDGWMISIAWAAQGVVWVAAGFVARQADLRFASFGLFALVLVRVFIVDIVALDPAYRIVTFLVVGVILLGVAAVFARRRQAEA